MAPGAAFPGHVPIRRVRAAPDPGLPTAASGPILTGSRARCFPQPCSRTMDAIRPASPSARRGLPADRVTRGKTAGNRLRGSDHFLLHYDPALLTRRAGPWARALCVDLGYGATPRTTLEWARRLRTRRDDLPVLGVELDPDRVARARPYRDAHTDFRLGGFALPLRDGESVRLIRAFNVLRQYEEQEALPAWDGLCAQLLPGGLLLEGTSDPLGRIWSACVLRRSGSPAAGTTGTAGTAAAAGTTAAAAVGTTAWRLEALVLGVNLRLGFDPGVLQTRLPKAFIHRMVPGEPVHGFLEGCKRAAAATRAQAVWGPRSWFAATAAHLAGEGHDVIQRGRWLRRGWLVWRRPPVPGTTAASADSGRAA